ncbi:MAG: flagellar filament capping protein FliD, partial [Treponema sp.]|nr:flagellar filament capping protein FliD [Treponema sp.]
MPGINIPGVTDQYKTNDTVEKLMQIERVPLTREQNTLKSYQAQQSAWRDVNKKLNALRDSVKTLYSYENPFNNKLASSTDEFALTATATRSAEYQSFKIEVIQPATADRFLTAELDSNYKVAPGTYTFKVADKSITVRWNGGSLDDFSKAINNRGGDTVKSMVIGASAGKKTLLVESLKTGDANRLTFEGDAKNFALSSGMISPAKTGGQTFGTSKSEIKSLTTKNENEQAVLPRLTNTNVTISDKDIVIPPRSAFMLNIPSGGNAISFTLTKKTVEDVTVSLNKKFTAPEMPDAGEITFEDITIYNNPSDSELEDFASKQTEILDPIKSKNVVYAIMQDGSEKEISTPNILTDETTSVNINLQNYEGIQGIAIRNRNTGTTFTMSSVSIFDTRTAQGFTPNNAVSTAMDAIIKYEGITIRRPNNDIDDVVPEVTLHVHEKTDRTATIKISPDKESAKDALITFVGRYNEAIAEINVLSQNKMEIVDELTYLSDSEREKMTEKLGMFLGDFSLTSVKSNLQIIINANYNPTDNAVIKMLSQVGISTNASGIYGGYSPNRLRGYLEIDEKKMDEVLETHLEDIKNMFGFDTDGDLIIDSGIAYRTDQELTAYVRTGGIISTKTGALDTKIKSSQQQITKLEAQMAKKERELRQKYAAME